MSFIHLHNHTNYSILEWLPKPKDYVKKALDFWMSAVAITDTWNIHWCHELYKEAKSAWIKPILWIEIFLESSLDKSLYHKIVLLAKNLKWYKNIIKLATISHLNNFWTKQFITFNDLKKYSNDIICLSGPIEWEISYYILSWQDEQKIVNRIKEYEDIFDWHFYLELLYHDDIPKQRLVTDRLIELHYKYWHKVVAANNCYYIEKDDKKTQDIIMALWTGDEIENPDRKTLFNWDYSFLSNEEIESLFWFIPEAIKNTQLIADMVDIQIETGWVLIPKYNLPKKDQKIFDEAKSLEKNESNIKKLSSDEWYLRYLSYQWLNWRYNSKISKNDIFELVKKLDKPWLDKKLTETSPEELKELSLIYYTDKKKEIINTFPKELQEKITRLEYELLVVHEMWFDAYFLIVADYINWARKQWIPVWPWRWSAAWSLMAFLTWITDIDPLPYGLLFERFLNPSRISMPDIDTDFSDDGREQVIKYCMDKYGSDHVAQICTFGTFAARAAVKDVWRVMWVPFSEMNELAKLIPEKPWTKLKTALEESIEFKNAYDTNPKYKEIIDNALKIEWNVRQVWVHACAVIIAPEPMTNFTALAHPPKDKETIITQYSADPLEDLGLLKMDFLWLRNLTIIKRTIEIVKANKNIDIDISNISLDDKKVFDVFASWDTTWVFQFESEWMRKYLIDLWPDSFEDLIAMVSLYRPGPLAYIPTYIERKYWREEIKYMTDELISILEWKWYSKEEIEEEKRKLEEDLWPILDVTNWIAIYQEQLMSIVQYMAWFSLWEADLLRRWIWKKKLEVVEVLKKEFIEKWANYKWYKPETTNYIYTEMIMPAANYSFNKSHAACYALIAYQTAYLKAYFPTEFFTSMMISDEENTDRVVLEVSESISKWIQVLPPSVNESLKHFTYIDDNTIRFWLKAIKWLWDGPIDAIINWRKGWPFKSLDDFIKRVWLDVLNKKSLEALILSWSMDDFWERWQLFNNIQTIINYSKNKQKQLKSAQIWLFDSIWEEEAWLKLQKTTPYTFEQKLLWEKQVLWFYVSGHPLDGLSTYIEKRSKNHKMLKMSFEEIEKLPEKEKKKNTIIQTVWFIKDIRKVMTKTGWTMVFLYCENYFCDFEVTIFQKDYNKYKDILSIDKIAIITWWLNINTEYKRKSILARELKIVSLSFILDQARDLWYYDNKKFNKFLRDTNDIKKEEVKENKTDHKDSIQNNIQEYIIKIPKYAKKNDLLDLKEFLKWQKSWNINIFLDLKWQKIDTKVSIDRIDKLVVWEKKKWW